MNTKKEDKTLNHTTSQVRLVILNTEDYYIEIFNDEYELDETIEYLTAQCFVNKEVVGDINKVNLKQLTETFKDMRDEYENQ